MFALSWAGQLLDTAREQVCFVHSYDGVACNPKSFNTCPQSAEEGGGEVP